MAHSIQNSARFDMKAPRMNLSVDTATRRNTYFLSVDFPCDCTRDVHLQGANLSLDNGIFSQDQPPGGNDAALQFTVNPECARDA